MIENRQDWRPGREMSDEETRQWALYSGNVYAKHAHGFKATKHLEGPASDILATRAGATRGFTPNIIIYDEIHTWSLFHVYGLWVRRLQNVDCDVTDGASRWLA
ncbi:hypothetical protein, partial [Streptomyces sp. NPDC055085]